MRRWIAVMAVAVAAGCGDGPEIKPPRATPKPVPDRVDLPSEDYGKLDLLAGLEKQSLRNGMTVFVKEDRRLPIVSVVTVYRVGSVHEPEGTSGLAHFLEHMLFKGTDKYAKGEIDRLTVRAGGANNAETQNDCTLYWFTVAADSLDDVLQIEASRMRNSTLDPKEFDEERNVVLNELWDLLDSPSGQLQYEIDQAVFKQHSYRRPGWGFEKDLKSVPHETMRAFYRQHYGPNNASIVIVGDVDPGKAFARVRELFGGIERVAEAVPPTPPEPEQTAERRVEIPTEKAVDRIGLAWRTNTAGTPEDYAMDVLQSLLTDGKDSRLYKRLVVRDRAVSDDGLEAVNDARRYDGVMYIFAELQEEKDAAAVEKAILDELEQLKVKPVGGRELQKAKNRITAGFIFSKETTLGLATSVGSYEGLGVPGYIRDYLAKVNAVTPESLCAAVKAVFRPQNRTVAVARAKRQRAAAPRVEPQAAPAEFGEYHEHRLRNGLTILIKPRTGLPIASVVAYVDAGPLNEPPDKAGVAALTGRMLDQGFESPDARTMTADQIAAALDYTGAQMSTSAKGVEIKTLTRDLGMVLDVLRDMLLYPSFPKEKLDEQKEQQLHEIQLVGDSPPELAREIWFKEVYAGHPLERPANGLAETVGGLTRADVRAHHKAFYRPDNTIIAVAGNVDPQAILRELRKRFAEWPAPGPTVVTPLPHVQRAEKGKLIVEYRKKDQISVCLGHVSLPHTDPDFFAMRVFEQIFCDSPTFTDRLSRIVREEMHLAYSLGGTVTNMDRTPAPFVLHIESGAQNGLAARDRTLKIIDELLRDGPKEEELELARSYLLRSMPFRWESAESLARYMVTVRRLRLGIDWPLRYRQAIAAVRKDDVLRAARAHISPASITTVVVGPVDREGKVIEDEKK